MLRPIERIYISGHRGDYRFTRCLVTSIRQFYPDIPITLIKDEINGAYDTTELEGLFGVECFETAVKQFGWGMAKLEPLFLDSVERILVLDSDIVFLGRVLDKLERVDADFVVEECDHDEADIQENYFDLEALSRRYQDFRYPGYVFNGGQFVAQSGMMSRDDFEPFISFEEPRRPRQRDVFSGGEQGIVNFVLHEKQQRGELSVAREDFMKWPPAVKKGRIRVQELDREGYPFLLHWAGRKHPALVANPLGEVLRYFEIQYHRRRLGRQG